MKMKKFLLALCILLCCAGASRAQVEYPDVPLDDPAYSDFELISPRELEFECDFGQVKQPDVRTRYELAIGVARLLERIETTEKAKRAGETTPPVPSAPDLSKPENLAAFKRLVEKFRPELKVLGVNVNTWKINGTLLLESKIAPSFTDVPKDHWAFEAVEKLRKSGIVVGYSDGS